MMTKREEPTRCGTDCFEFAESVRRGVLLGAAALVLALPPAVDSSPRGASPAAKPSPGRVERVADFGREPAAPYVRQMAAWVAHSGDNGNRSFVIVDKKDAKVFLFDRDARLRAAAPALLGAARGDDTFPGVENKPIAQVKPEEKTTPAGRFVASRGMSTSRGEDVVWVDFESAVSMHRVIKVPARLRSLGSPSPKDNRMSFGCINVPDAFYEKALRPAVDNGGAIIYVLPETRSLRETFKSFYEVDAPSRVAQR